MLRKVGIGLAIGLVAGVIFGAIAGYMGYPGWIAGVAAALAVPIVWLTVSGNMK